MAVRIRSATPDDVSALLLLIAEHAEYEGTQVRVEAKGDALACAMSGSQPRLFVWLSEIDGVIAGYASATLEFSTWNAAEYLHMDCLFLRAEARNRGIGVALLAAIRAFAAGHGCGEIQWQTPDWNIDAARFYRRAGADEICKRRFILRLTPPAPHADIC